MSHHHLGQFSRPAPASSHAFLARVHVLQVTSCSSSLACKDQAEHAAGDELASRRKWATDQLVVFGGKPCCQDNYHAVHFLFI